MFERIRDERERRKIEKKMAPHFKKAAADNDHHRMDRVIADANREFELLNMRIQRRETNRLLAEAERLDIDTPSNTEVWQDTPHGSILVTQARSELRRRVDEEKSRRREVKAWWWKTIILPAFTTLIGLIGALTGLIAVLRRH